MKVTEAQVSRRDFLFGMLGRSSPTDNAAGGVPDVSPDSCEARYGCRKCFAACPAPGALEVRENSLFVSQKHCVRCGLCAGICPVAAIQMPEMSERAYLELLDALQNSPAPRKTLVITCSKDKVPHTPGISVEQVPGIGVIGVRQLAMAASTSINATIIYCPDGLCVGKERVKHAVDLIASTNDTNLPVYYLEGPRVAARIEHIHNSTQKRESAADLTATPWNNYVTAIEKITAPDSPATGLAITDMRIAESCTLCYACVDRCPHKAVKIESGRLLFDSRNCTGCGYCGQICPEHAITLLEMEGSIRLAERSVYRDDMVRCSKCNAEYTSAKMIRKVTATLRIGEIMPICPSCKEKGMYDSLFGNQSSKITNQRKMHEVDALKCE